MTLRVGSLFTGIGGIDLGLERAGGFRIAWQSEIDPYACRILKRAWPGVPNLGDVTEAEFPEADVVVGGFPCQPVSQAGNRQGVTDDRWLWPAFERAVRKVRPRYVFVENVPGLLSANDGGAFGEVLGDLAAVGYDAEWDCIPAQAVGAPHRRDRICLVAYRDVGGRVHGQAGILATETGAEALRQFIPSRETALADTDGGRRPRRDVQRQRRAGPKPSTHGRGPNVADAEGEGLPKPKRQRDRIPGQPRPKRRRVGPGRSTSYWSIEPPVGRVADGAPHRVDRLRCLGNAVVPQWAEWVGRRILEAEAVLNGR